MKLKNTEIKILQGDITELPEEVDAIVNPANNKLKMGGGVAGAIRRKGGEDIQKECDKIGEIKIGSAVVTSAGKLKYKYVIHAATMGLDFKTNQEYIRLATRNSLFVAEEKDVTSIAFPALGCGVGGFPYEEAAKIMAEEVAKYIVEHDETKIRKIIFVLFDKSGFEIFNKIVPEHIGYIQRKIGHYPIPTVDIIIKVKIGKNKEGIVLIERKNPPYGWALPGGFVEYNESLETTAIREAEEETGLKVKNLRQFKSYSEPGRDPRFHTISTVFIAEAEGSAKASSDAKNVIVATKEEILSDKYKLVFDHKKILQDYFESLK